MQLDINSLINILQFISFQLARIFRIITQIFKNELSQLIMTEESDNMDLDPICACHMKLVICVHSMRTLVNGFYKQTMIVNSV